MVISFFLFAATEVNLKLLFNRVCVCVKVCIVEGMLKSGEETYENSLN